MAVINGNGIEVVHIRHDGRSNEFVASDLDLGENATSHDLTRSVEQVLELSPGTLSGYEVDFVESTRTAVIRPQAKFG